MELKYLNEWEDQLKDLVAKCISDLEGHFKSPECKVLNQPNLKAHYMNYLIIILCRQWCQQCVCCVLEVPHIHLGLNGRVGNEQPKPPNYVNHLTNIDL